MLIGALEAGGTKMVCALGREDGTIIEQVSIPTTTPEETIPKITAYFKDKGIEALGIGAFGPVGVDPKADNYGYILETPKLAWRNKDLLGGLKKELNVPMGIDTDVNGLPLSIILSWYEQKAVADLLALLSLGVKHIYLGPSLPAFISPNVLQYLVDTFNLTPISTATDDLKTCLKQSL